MILFGRSSSHFTRVVRLFAVELGVTYQLRVVADLLATTPKGFGENPALRLPVLETPTGQWFGALAISRELARRARREVRIVWPEQLVTPLLSNAQELAVQAMSTEVELIMSGKGAAQTPHLTKRRASLEASMRWLDERVDDVVAALPDRDLSYLEVALFCLVEHLSFREVLATEPFPRLLAFARQFGERPSASATPFAFDAKS